LLLCPLLVLVGDMAGDTAAHRAQHPVVHHVASHRPGQPAGDAADGMGLRRAGKAQAPGNTGGENQSSGHAFGPLLRVRADHQRSEAATGSARATFTGETQEGAPMRRLLLAGLVSLATSTAAFADASVAGAWHATLGSGVAIDMTITADGGWTSQTLQKKAVVRRMKGTYTQTQSGADAGTLVFTPTEVSGGDGQAQTETDQYKLADNGRRLSLTSDGDTMVFNKQGH
jgi:hypothetical protein